jgi:uncharacterized protein (DUF433 family)
MKRMPDLDRITIDPNQCGSGPWIRGARLRVVDLLERPAAGASREEILPDYAFPEPADIQAALLYAARFAYHPIVPAA